MAEIRGVFLDAFTETGRQSSLLEHDTEKHFFSTMYARSQSLLSQHFSMHLAMVLASLTTVKLLLWIPFGRSLSFVILLCLHLRSFGSGGIAGASLDSE